MQSLLLLAGAAVVGGCQMTPVASDTQFVEHRQRVDAAGLTSVVMMDPLRASISPPAKWTALKVQKSLLYTHQQWRSPTKRTGVGVTYIRMPLPLSTKTLVKFAMNEAGKRAGDGRVIRQWNDALGREWFEAENAKYHMTGYVMTRGLDAWINYCGYRQNEELIPEEYEVGRRALDTVLPMSVDSDPGSVAAAK